MPMDADDIRLWSRGRFAVKRFVGSGRVGDEYVAHDVERDTDVLLTIIPAHEPTGRQRFEVEYRQLRTLDHPGVQPLFDHGSGSSFVYFTGPYLHGETLRQRLQREGQLPLEEAFRIARQAALALAHAHEKSIVHRDLVPDQIYLAADGRVIVMGFGAPALILGFDSKEQPSAATGNPTYLAPEHLSGALFDGRSDVYCLGNILFEMLTGMPPVAGARSALDIFTKILIDPPPAPSSIRKDLPPEVDAVVLKALAKDRSDRYADAAEFARRLKVPG